jgi:hypothetical protein
MLTHISSQSLVIHHTPQLGNQHLHSSSARNAALTLSTQIELTTDDNTPERTPPLGSQPFGEHLTNMPNTGRTTTNPLMVLVSR